MLETKENREDRVKRLKYQSWYRGCKETDKILGLFARENLDGMSDAELDEFDKIMLEDDWDIYAWATGKQAIPDEYKNSNIMQNLMSFDIGKKVVGGNSSSRGSASDCGDPK